MTLASAQGPATIKSKLVANANIRLAFASSRVNPHFHAPGKYTPLRNSVQFFGSPKPLGQHPSILRFTLVPVLDYTESDHEEAKKCCRCRIMKCFWDKIKHRVCQHRPHIFFCYLRVLLFTNAIYPPTSPWRYNQTILQYHREGGTGC